MLTTLLMMCSFVCSVINEILSKTVSGDKTVKLKHMNKTGLKRLGMLLVSITVPYHLYAESCMFLNYPEFILTK